MTTTQSKLEWLKVRTNGWVTPIVALLLIPVGMLISRNTPIGDLHTLGDVIATLALTALVISTAFKAAPWLGGMWSAYFGQVAERNAQLLEKRLTDRQRRYREADAANRLKQSRK